MYASKTLGQNSKENHCDSGLVSHHWITETRYHPKNIIPRYIQVEKIKTYLEVQ